jgi:hypothetical protein
MKKDIRSFIAPEYVPDELAEYFKEPSTITVGPARRILEYWRQRQKEGLRPLNIHNYLDGSGELVAREPRELLEGHDSGEESAYQTDPDDPPIIRKPQRRKVGHGKGRSKPSRPMDHVSKSTSQDRDQPLGLRASTPSDSNILADTDPSPALSSSLQSPSGGETSIARSNPIVPSPELRSQLMVQTKLEALDIDLGGLDERLKRMVLNAVGKTLGLPQTTPINPPHPVSTLDPSSEELPTLADPIPTPPTAPTSDSGIGPDAGVATRRRRKQEDMAQIASNAVEGPSIPVAPQRRRRKEEDLLAESAALAGAKSGPRQKRATRRLK